MLLITLLPTFMNILIRFTRYTYDLMMLPCLARWWRIMIGFWYHCLCWSGKNENFWFSSSNFRFWKEGCLLMASSEGCWKKKMVDFKLVLIICCCYSLTKWDLRKDHLHSLHNLAEHTNFYHGCAWVQASLESRGVSLLSNEKGLNFTFR